jgi:hypothetical protein
MSFPAELRGSAFGLLAAVQRLQQPGRQRHRRPALDRRLPADAFVYLVAWMLPVLAGLATTHRAT